MEWLTPVTAIYAAALAVPSLLLLYFLKLKRREYVVSSTLLWKRAVQDLQVNAPFQRLRRNILLLLQLLALLAMLLALAGPVLSRISRGGARYVLLIDRSASMNATDVGPSRLDKAKSEAAALVESLQEGSLFSFGGSRNQIMVIAFDKHAKVMCNFTSDARQLLTAIDAVSPGDGVSQLSEAIVVAQAFATPEELANNRSSQARAHLVLFSDGRIQDMDKVLIGAEEVDYHGVGESGDNVGITAMRARRSYEDPGAVEVFSSISNYGDAPVTCDVQLSLDGNVQAVKSVTIPARPSNQMDAERAGKLSVSFSLSHAGAGVVEVRHLHSDILSADDAAWAVLSPPRRLSVLLVTEGNPVLASALQACSPAELEVVDPAQFDSNDTLAGFEQTHDMIVLDNHVPAVLPRSRYLVFGRPPQNIGVSVAGELENQLVVDWRPKHAVLQHVNLLNLFAATCYTLDLPRDAEVLAEFNESPAIALLRRGGSVFLLASFDVLQSNWPFEPGFVLFCYNAAAFLGTQSAGDERANLEVGQPLVLDGLEPETSAVLTGPGLVEREVSAGTNGEIRFPGTQRAGIYGLQLPDRTRRFFAVNMLDPQESNVRPQQRIQLSGQAVEAGKGLTSKASLPLWPWLVGLVLLLACVEWIVYSLKVRI